MTTKRKRTASPWSHEALERRGYRKCPHCWRHLVKIEEHVAAHEAGLIGPDGKRRDRTPEEKQRWATRYNGSPAAEHYRQLRRTFVPRAEYERILRLPTVEFGAFRKEIDAAVDQDP